MIKKLIPLSAPLYDSSETFSLSSKTKSYTNIESQITSFENKTQEILQTNKPVLALNSGTSAIHLSLILAGVTSGDEVLCQAFTFVACANPILYIGAIPIFVGSEENSWNMCVEALEEAYLDRIKRGRKPKAIIAASLYGMPFNYTKIKQFAIKNGLVLIDDSAEALGAYYEDKACGTLGDFGIISFNNNKIITAFGGGVLVCPNQEVYDRAKYLATQAKKNAPFYYHTEIGFNYRMSHISSIIGQEQLELLEDRKRQRVEILTFYKSCFDNFEGVRIHESKKPEYHSNYWLTNIIIDRKNELQLTNTKLKDIFWQENIETRYLWKPLHTQPLYKDCAYYGNNISVELFEKGLCLPSGPDIGVKEKDRILNCILSLKT